MTPSRLSLPTLTCALLLQGIFLETSLAGEPDGETSAPSAGTAETALADPAATGAGDSAENEADNSAREALIRQALIDKELNEQTIARLEEQSSQNAFSPELSQAYMDLGSTLRTLGQYEDAVLAYDKALQTVRVSNGLNSDLQIPILEEMRLSNEARTDWDAVDKNIHLIHYIATRTYDVGDERRVQATNELGKWKVKASREKLFPGFKDSAREAATIYRNEIRQLEEADYYEGKKVHLASMYLGAAAADFSMARTTNDRPLSEFQTSGQRTIQERRCSLVATPDGKVVQVCETVEVPNLSYYLDPSNQKSQEIGGYLDDMKDSILQAFQILQTETSEPDRRDSLLAEVQRMTKEYNEFVSEISPGANR